MVSGIHSLRATRSVNYTTADSSDSAAGAVLRGTSVRIKQTPISFELAAACSAAVQLIVLVALTPTALAGHADFFVMFHAASLVWHGKAALMYAQPLFNHLPFEAVMLAPLAPLGPRAAYGVFWTLNCVLLIAAVRILRLRGFFGFAAFAFVPVGIALLQGQDSVITLFLAACALAALTCDREFVAGFLMGLTVYKPQIGLPICGLMFLWRRWRFAAGFAASASACVAVSVVTVGAGGFFAYVKLLHTMDPVRYGIIGSDMVGLRGLLSPVVSGHALLASTIVASAALAIYVFLKGRRAAPNEQFALAIACGALVSYHTLTHDLSIMLVPLAIAWRFGTEDRAVWWTALAAFALPALVVQTSARFLMAVPMLAFCMALARWTDSRQTRGDEARKIAMPTVPSAE